MTRDELLIVLVCNDNEDLEGEPEPEQETDVPTDPQA